MNSTFDLTASEQRVALPPLSVTDLTVELTINGAVVPVVSDLSIEVGRGETLGLVGESGSGKTLTALAIMGVLPRSARVRGGEVRLDGRDLLSLSPKELSRLRGNRISMIFQDPMRSLNPAFTVGEQIAEVARKHLRRSRRAAWVTAVEMLDRVAIREPHRRAHDYPSEFSGGMAQRAMIAMALVTEPAVLIADEPTTALDVTVQAQVLLLLQRLQQEMGLGLVLVTHDLGVVAEMCDDVSVMYAGQVVESGPVGKLFDHPNHPYTAALLASLPTSRHRTSPFGFIPGVVPAPSAWPEGCRFAPRCSFAVRGRCDAPGLVLTTLASGQTVRCRRADELTLPGIDRQ